MEAVISSKYLLLLLVLSMAVLLAAGSTRAEPDAEHQSARPLQVGDDDDGDDDERRHIHYFEILMNRPFGGETCTTRKMPVSRVDLRDPAAPDHPSCCAYVLTLLLSPLPPPAPCRDAARAPVVTTPPPPPVCLELGTACIRNSSDCCAGGCDFDGQIDACCVPLNAQCTNTTDCCQGICYEDICRLLFVKASRTPRCCLSRACLPCPQEWPLHCCAAMLCKALLLLCFWLWCPGTTNNYKLMHTPCLGGSAKVRILEAPGVLTALRDVKVGQHVQCLDSDEEMRLPTDLKFCEVKYWIHVDNDPEPMRHVSYRRPDGSSHLMASANFIAKLDAKAPTVAAAVAGAV